ncbi:MAG: metal ABC transporter permease [Alphaproteobacteria bacterium]|nr:metal ABC transporter permease [Alphaproteobacteria bacterium]
MFETFMINAFETSAIVAIVSGVVGFFTVLRGAAFAAHAIPNGAFAGAAGASLLGISKLVGLGVFALVGAVLIAALGRRSRSDVATALTVALLLGLGDLFLSRSEEYSAQVFALLFGDILGVASYQIVPTALLGLACILVILMLYRPLLLSSVVPDVAEARGISPRWMDLAFLIILALVTTMAVPIVGAFLIFSLLIGPAAAARAFTDRPLPAMVMSSCIALVVVWAAIAVSYTTNLPVGFFVGSFSGLCYGLGRGWAIWGDRLRMSGRPAG